MRNSSKRLELNKILEAAAGFAVLEGAREEILTCEPVSDLDEARRLLDYTEEAQLLLFELGAGAVEYFPPLDDAAERAAKRATLTCGELLSVSRLLRSARVCRKSVHSLSDGRISLMRELTQNLTADSRLEEEITSKILGEDEISDHASEKLFSLRREIRVMGERIRARLQAYLTGEEKKFLQDGIVTVRGDRYVIPVKAEYKRSIKGFVHDRSATGATVYIEPEEVLEMNNELRSLMLDEREEQARILSELSRAVGLLCGELTRDEEILTEVDGFYARAAYGYSIKAVKPALNDKGVVEIVRGRHPLLDKATAVPVSVSVGGKYDFLIISGANTGGKTVTLKMCGLFCLMAECGLFVPAESGTRLSVFKRIFCDVGDSQSIEENLSTFSSHLLNLKEISEQAERSSFVLIDEPGGGTDPEEGQAIARAILNGLVKKGCRGIVTTHYTALKEFAAQTERMENGCMEFDSRDYRPLYRLKIGAPGSSNALAICRRLGLSQETVEEAKSYLSEGARAFENTVRAAEESRIRAEEIRVEAERTRTEWQNRLRDLEREEAKFKAEREKFLRSSKIEARRIVNEHTARAEELLNEMEQIFKREELTERDLIRARTLKNEMEKSAIEREEEPVRLTPVNPQTLKAGDRVYIKSMSAAGEVLSINKNTVEVQCGSLRVRSKLSDLCALPEKAQEKNEVRVVRNLAQKSQVKPECNVIGLSSDEALMEVETFLDAAVLSNLEQVRIVHGMGTGKLRSVIHAFLKKDKRVAEFRLGAYGEGESGVTIVKLK